MRLAIATAVISASGAVFSPRTISHSFMTLAGEKKCMPSTSCGRLVIAAMSLMFRYEVLVARTAPGLANWSSLPNTSFLIAMVFFRAAKASTACGALSPSKV
ncbi:MAG: hypothetical protein BWY86_00637 [Candidatus Aminicenantes bacterium ADurb.Bin508]|nr:MAG: hypothetical protein BWY86_00637 [Candidatus Aminicenantes bacterium ADurb.Bin508]